MSSITIYHNPACGTSRNVLGLIRNSGVEPAIIEYLKTPPDAKTLTSLIAAMGITPRELLRQKGTPYAELGLSDAKWTDDQLIGFMLEHPILINRPIVVSPLGTRLCRPSEAILDILPCPQLGAFSKEDGEPVANADLPNIDPVLLERPSPAALFSPERATHAPRFLLLYGSLRERSYSRLVAEEAARLLQALGGDVRLFNPSGLPLVDDASENHPKVRELHDLVQWAEGMIWSSPERHGAMTGLMKTQIDWIPLSVGAVRPTQGKTLAVMQVSGGSQSFNAVNQMRVLGRWMRMLTIPNQSSVAKAYQEFDDAGRMKPSPYYDRVVDVVEELMKFTLLTRDATPCLVDRYSERKETAAALSMRMKQAAI